jgi:secondary thiamine-phosphate synthase enzyme
MAVFQTKIEVQTQGQGLVLISSQIQRALKDALEDALAATQARSAPPPSLTGILHVFLQHTSASLLIQENADPSARHDLEEFIERLVPENQSWYRHLDEGPDDTVSHMKAAVTPTALTIPVSEGKLLLGTWQGVYLWEHRRAPHRRKIVLTLLS